MDVYISEIAIGIIILNENVDLGKKKLMYSYSILYSRCNYSVYLLLPSTHLPLFFFILHRLVLNAKVSHHLPYPSLYRVWSHVKK